MRALFISAGVNNLCRGLEFSLLESAVQYRNRYPPINALSQRFDRRIVTGKIRLEQRRR